MRSQFKTTYSEDKLTALSLNDLADRFIVMDRTIVQDYYTPWTWKGC